MLAVFYHLFMLSIIELGVSNSPHAPSWMGMDCGALCRLDQQGQVFVTVAIVVVGQAGAAAELGVEAVGQVAMGQAATYCSGGNK